MNLVRELRSRAGLTQQDLAKAACTSQSTIAAYESGKKSPTLRTIENLAESLGLELAADFVPRMTREDRRSLAFHRAIADILKKNPDPIIYHARENLIRLMNVQPHAAGLFEQWNTWLDLPVAQLISKMLDPQLEAREMRQVSPFSGILSARERARLLHQFHKDYGR